MELAGRRAAEAVERWFMEQILGPSLSGMIGEGAVPPPSSAASATFDGEHRRPIQPLARDLRCVCALDVLMAQGCQCGGQ
jgi:hypothetical protein